MKNLFFPKYFASQAIKTYFIALGVISIVFVNYALPIDLFLIGAVSVIFFFQGSNNITKTWLLLPEKKFVKKLFTYSLIIRLIYVVFIYIFNNIKYGTYYECDPGDIIAYVSTAENTAIMIREGWQDMINIWLNDWQLGFSDIGYIFYLLVIYMATGSFSLVILPLLFKILFGALTCIFGYRIAQRHFDESTARMAGVFCMLQFNMIWWCGSMMKETEMVFLFMWFANSADQLLSMQKIKWLNIVYVVVICVLLFSFRTALGIVAVLSLALSVMLLKRTVISIPKKIIFGLLLAACIVLASNTILKKEVLNLQEQAQGTSNQKDNMEWRARRSGDKSNTFAKYAGAAVFAPLIFTIPFPSMVVAQESQEIQMMQNGGNYVKNVMSFFVIFALFSLLFSGDWRKHVFIIAMLCGYLMALVLSNFAQSGRFHMPVIPFEMIFAAYGVSIITRKKEKWFNYALFLEFLIMFGWSWFKLKGRGMI